MKNYFGLNKIRSFSSDQEIFKKYVGIIICPVYIFNQIYKLFSGDECEKNIMRDFYFNYFIPVKYECAG